MGLNMHGLTAALVAALYLSVAHAQTAPLNRPLSPSAPVQERRPPAFRSPEVLPDRRVTFRIFAPRASNVRLNASDIPGPGPRMAREASGIWETMVSPLAPGAYRYEFVVDGVSTIDPSNPSTSESYTRTWSLFELPGSDLMDTRKVPHGTVASLTYYSSALSRFRRMHVYTPPGYERNHDRYPVLYLLHGAGDSDDSWSTVGRAGFILDNLIAAKKAKPMIVVMPAGHTGPMNLIGADPFEKDFLAVIIPTIEKTYRVRTHRNDRAIAGLSMGGGQALNIAIPHLDRFGYVGVFSAGLFRAYPFRRPSRSAHDTGVSSPSLWEQQHLAQLNNKRWKRGLKLLWFSTGQDDPLLPITRFTINLLNRHGFKPVFIESPGRHTWLNWRNYLIEFAPQLFR